jgi:hypothetical protein
MRRWVLRRLGALDWLDEIECMTRRALTAEKRRDNWQARVEGAESKVVAAEERADAAEKSAVAADLERAVALRLAQAHIEVLELILEPDFGEICQKIRCHSEDIATRLASQVARQTGLAPQSMDAYTCNRCPPQPVTGERWWHCRMADYEARGMRKYGKRGRRTWVKRSSARPMTSEEGARLNERLFGQIGQPANPEGTTPRDAD